MYVANLYKYAITYALSVYLCIVFKLQNKQSPKCSDENRSNRASNGSVKHQRSTRSQAETAETDEIFHSSIYVNIHEISTRNRIHKNGQTSVVWRGAKPTGARL